MLQKNPAKQYQSMSAHTGVMDADPHRLVHMLLNGAIDKLSQAKGYMNNKDYEKKGNSLSAAISIIGGLQSSLDTERGGEIAKNLEDLYDYMVRQIFTANLENDLSLVDEVIGLLNEIRSAWMEIRDQALAIFKTQTEQGTQAVN